jgi:hypothetical protein
VATADVRFRAALAAVATTAAVIAVAPGLASREAPGLDPLVFVSRQIPDHGSIYAPPARGLAGVGAFARLQVASPGSLLLRDGAGRVRPLVDGQRPTPRSLQLVDVSSADVSYDGRLVVFAGLAAGDHRRDTSGNPDAWRIYVIGLDGRGLRQLTFDDPARRDLPAGLRAVDDYDPVWLPDGRIVFASTRWPSYAHYGGVRTSNLYVMDADGGRLHRITAERNGADRPTVDPLTGRIVFARWWRNQRFPLDRLDSQSGADGIEWKDGLSAVRGLQLDGRPENNDLLWRNAWHLATIRPDGTELAMWGGATDGRVAEQRNHVYGGAFARDGAYYANFYPMFNMTEASGFGGVRRFSRGPGTYAPVIGVTDLEGQLVEPRSFGVYRGRYATDALPLRDGRLLIALAADVTQDYGLFLLDGPGGTPTAIYDQPGTAEVRAVTAAPRPTPPRLADTVPLAAASRPPAAASSEERIDGDGTFVFDAMNVYFNAPVDWAIGHAPAVGSAATLRVYADHQRGSLGSFPGRDWPLLIATLPVDAAGAVRDDRAPANVPLFEQLRSADGRVPVMGPPAAPTGAAYVAGLNYGRPGAVVRCVGCHAGHTMIPVPPTRAAAAWTNLAPGASVTVSSAGAGGAEGLNDRVARRGSRRHTWTSAPGQVDGQWARLTFPVPVVVRQVRLYGLGGDAATVRVDGASVRLLADADADAPLAERRTGAVSPTGSAVGFPDVAARVVLVRLDEVSGRLDGAPAAGLAEIEVVAKGVDRPRPSSARR